MKILLFAIISFLITGCIGWKTVHMNYTPTNTKQINFRLNSIEIDVDGNFDCGHDVTIKKDTMISMLKDDVSFLFDGNSPNDVNVKLSLKNHKCNYELSSFQWLHLINLWTWSSIFGLPYTFYEGGLLFIIEIYNKQNDELIFKFSKSYDDEYYLNLYSDSIDMKIIQFTKDSMKLFKTEVEQNKLELYGKYLNFKQNAKKEIITPKDNYVMLKILTKNDEINNDALKIIQNGVEEILTENKFSLISKEVQEQTLKEQAEQRKTECYDESCLVEVGKMIAAKNLLIIEIIKSEETYMFNLKFVDLETGATLKSKSSVYDNSIKNIKELLIFSKELTQNIIK